MIIESIRIDAFGRLSGYTCAPGEGLTVIEGDNESGKSTLAAFIRYMLYGFAPARGAELGEKKKRIDWQSGRAAGSMVVRVGERRYRIERITTASTGPRERETYRETSAIIDLETNTPLPAGECPGERFLGVPESVYLQTAFVGQIGSSRPDGDSLQAAIENLLFAGDEQVSLPRALDKLEGLRRSLLHKNGKGGELYELREREEALAARLATAQEQNAALLATENELLATRREREECEKKLHEAKEAEALTHNILLVLAYDRLHAAEAVLAEAEAALIHLDGLPAHRLSERDLTDLAIARRASEEAGRRLAEAAREHAARAAAHVDEETAAALQRAEGEGGLDLLSEHTGLLSRRSMALLIAAAAMGACGLLLLILSFVALSGAIPPLLGGGLLLLGGLALAMLGLAARRDVLAICRAYGAGGYAALLARLATLRTAAGVEQGYRTAEQEAATRLQAATLEHRRAMGELDTVVRRFDVRLPEKEPDAFLDRLVESVRAMLDKKKAREGERAEAAGLVSAFRQRLRGTSEAAARAALPAGELPDEDELQPEEWKKQVEYQTARRRILAERERELENSLLSARSRVEDPAMLEAALCELREKLDAENERHAACVMAYEALASAGQQLREEISPRLSGFACRLMGEMTNGKYERVGVGSDLSLSVGTEGGTRPPEYLSAGTQELVYLSLRMALLDLLYREKPPVCFDESFAHQDDGRLRRAISTLATLAAGGQQCLLFTCHTRESQAVRELVPGAPVIPLP